MLAGQGDHVERMGSFAHDDRITIVNIQALLPVKRQLDIRGPFGQFKRDPD